jgi:hypothetical protein
MAMLKCLVPVKKTVSSQAIALEPLWLGHNCMQTTQLNALISYREYWVAIAAHQILPHMLRHDLKHI